MIDISIIMSVYNVRSDFLNTSIKSIIEQSYRHYEFIIINDGADDSTSRILDSFNEKDSRITLIKQKNKGLTKALNEGIKIAKGKYIVRQDADDYSMPDRIEKQLRVVKNDNKIVLLGTDFTIIDDDSCEIATLRNSKYKDLKKRIYRSNPFAHGSLIFKRKIKNKIILYNEFYQKAQDYDLILRLSELGDIKIIDDVLYYWRFSKDGISQSGNNYFGKRALANYKRRVKNAKENFNLDYEKIEHGKKPGSYEFSIGTKLLLGGHYKRARIWLFNAFIKAPTNFRFLRHLIFASFPIKIQNKIRYSK